MGNIKEELEICAHLKGYDLVGITRPGGMAPGIAALAWNNTGSLGRTGGENDQAVLPSVPKTSWSAWNFTWRCIKGLWVMVKGRPGSGSTTM